MSTLVVTNLSLGAGGLPDGSVLTADIADNAITGPKIAAGAVSAADLDGNQTGSAPIYGARAWINFNGTGTVAIRGSGNITSLTDNGVGLYTLNFTTAMPDTNYAVVGISVFDATSGRSPRVVTPLSYTTTTCQVNSVSTASSEDNPFNHVIVLR